MYRKRSRRVVLGAFASCGAALAGCSVSKAPTTTRTSTSSSNAEMWPSVGYDAANTGYNRHGTGPDRPNERWQFRIGEARQAAPVVGQTTLGVGVAVWGHQNGLYYLDITDGEKLVSLFPGEGNDIIGRRLGHPSAPASDGEILYTGGGGHTTAPYIYAYPMTSLVLDEPRWRFRTGDQVIHSPITIADGTVYVGTASQPARLYALNAGTEQRKGASRWNRRVDGWITGAPAVADGTVVVGTHTGTVYAFDAANGADSWTVSVDEPIRAAPAVADGTVVVGSGEGSVSALDLASGDERWTFPTDGPIRTSPAIADTTVVIGSDDGRVYTLALESGEKQWSVPTGGPVQSSPGVVDGTVYVGSDDGHLYALALADGSERWHFETDGAIAEAPAIAGGVAYVCSRDGNLYAIGGDSSG